MSCVQVSQSVISVYAVVTQLQPHEGKYRRMKWCEEHKSNPIKERSDKKSKISYAVIYAVVINNDV